MKNIKIKSYHKSIRFFIIVVIMTAIITGIFELFYNPYKWVEKDGKWYYMDEQSNAVKTGWIKNNGFKYYLDENGVRQSGWIKDNGNLYYLYDTGEMATDILLSIEGKTYYFDANGAMCHGWIKYNDYYRYFTEDNGVMLTGWQDIGNAWYYLYSTGEMATGITKLGNDSYYFDDKGVLCTGWIKVDEIVGSSKSHYTISHWYYGDKDGHLKTFWQQIDNNWYYFYSNCEMAHDVLINGYYFNSSGCWSDDIPPNVVNGNGVSDDSNKPEVLYWKTIPVVVTGVYPGAFGTAKISVKTDEYNLTETFTQFKDKPYADVANSGALKVGDTIYCELYSWKKGESTITRRSLHELKYNN